MMDDVWYDVKEGTNHYEAYIPEDGFPKSVNKDSDKWIKLNLCDSQSGKYERTVNAYKVYTDSDGNITGVGKTEKIRNMFSKRFEKKGFAIPYVLLQKAKKEGIEIFILEVDDNNGNFIAEMVIPVRYALQNGRKFWESNSERQIFIPIDEWDILECVDGWFVKFNNFDDVNLEDENQMTLEDCFEKRLSSNGGK